MPSPPARRSSGRSPCTNRSNTCGQQRRRNPGARVLDLQHGRVRIGADEHLDRPACGRVAGWRWSAGWSPPVRSAPRRRRPRHRARSSRSGWSFASPVIASVSSTRCTTAARFTGWRASRILPAMTRPTSSRSFIMCARLRVWRAMMARASAAFGLPGSAASSTSTAAEIAPSGLRSSWLSMVRNSSFARLAASASRRAARARSVSSRPLPARSPSGRSCPP